MYLKNYFSPSSVSSPLYSGNIVGVQPYTTGNPSCSNHGLSTSRRWPGLCDDGSVFSSPIPVQQPTYENVIPDTDYNTGYDVSAYTDALNKYNQYEVAKVSQYIAPSVKPQAIKIASQPQYTSNSQQSTDYTFSSFGFNRQPQQQQVQQQRQQAVVTSAPVYSYAATTPKPVQEKHSAFYTYNWDSLFKNYYSFNTGK